MFVEKSGGRKNQILGSEVTVLAGLGWGPPRGVTNVIQERVISLEAVQELDVAINRALDHDSDDLAIRVRNHFYPVAMGLKVILYRFSTNRVPNEAWHVRHRVPAKISRSFIHIRSVRFSRA